MYAPDGGRTHDQGLSLTHTPPTTSASQTVPLCHTHECGLQHPGLEPGTSALGVPRAAIAPELLHSNLLGIIYLNR